MGSIYKRGGIYWIKYYKNGKPYRESARSDRMSEAIRKLKQREGEIAEGKTPNLRAERTTFEELVTLILNDYKVNGRRSIDRLGRSIEHLKNYFSGMKAIRIAPDMIETYKVKRIEEDNAENATINRELAALKRMFNLGADVGRVIHVPKIKMLRENNRRKGFFEADEFIALRAALPDYLKPIVTMAYYYGMRKQEILGLRFDQVDLREGEVRLEPEDTKTGEPRLIVLNDEMFSVLMLQKRNRDLKFPECSYVFYTDKGNRIKDFRKAWDKACKQAGLEGRIFHDFRRTAIRNMVRAGVPQHTAQQISGHKTDSVFKRYNIISRDDLKRAARQISIYHKVRAEEALEPVREFAKSIDGHNLGTMRELVGTWEDER